MKNYSIIIPIYNELNSLKELLIGLEPYSKDGHEIIIINDGSTDGSKNMLNNYDFFKLINLKNNYGKGIAVRIGLLNSKNTKIIIFDGDMELKTKEIKKLMKLDKSQKVYYVTGYRFESLNLFGLNFDFGNFIFTTFYNILFKTSHKDILCCAKSFYKTDININNLKSKGFDIDIELSLFIDKLKQKPLQIQLTYNRRSVRQGKKLKISDGWLVLSRVLKNTF